MADETWRAVDVYVEEAVVGEDEALAAARRRSDAAGLPPIAVTPAQGKFLSLLAGAIGARRVLEVGTLGGYSTIWLARGVGPEGHVVTLEVDPRHAEVARANLAEAGVAARVDVLLGPALDTLAALAAEGQGPFDLFFIDADKEANAEYFSWAVRLSRPGSVVVVDNVVRGGKVAEARSDDPAVRGTRRLFEAMAAEPRVEATALQTVGAKAYDGFALALVGH